MAERGDRGGKNYGYPFSAIVGQEGNEAGAVVECGESQTWRCTDTGRKGDGKVDGSAWSGCADPADEVVELPVSATEDRVVGL